ncbi:MAG: S1C family serine protease [Acetatifactor sp.]
MTEKEQNNQNDFLIEKIKERPINRKKLLRRTIITASMAVIFGLIACITFLVLEPVINNWLYPEEEPQIVVFPEDQEEMSPEDMLAENLPTESPQPTPEEADVILKEEQIEEILSGVILDKDNYRELYIAMSDYVSQMNRCMVTITAVTSNIDWFNNVQESRNQASGVIIANNGKELLVLADASSLRQAEKLILTFSNEVQAEAQIKQQDKYTNLAVLSVVLSELPAEMIEEDISLATLGKSNTKNLPGTPVIAMGSPMGTSNSIGYGMITSESTQVYAPDRNYRLLMTDIYGSQNAGGVLFNLQGEVIGMITSGKTGSDMKNQISAYGITELKKVIEKMSNGSSVAYMGISGLDVTKEANESQGVPYGAFVKEIAMDSPAMLTGIQRGDVITEMDGKKVTLFSDYSTILMQLDPGQTVELTVMRQSQNEYKEMKFSVELGAEK